MQPTLRHLSQMVKNVATLSLPNPMVPSQLPTFYLKRLASTAAKKKPLVNCACARHPVPEEKKVVKQVERPKDCDFDFRKMEVNPYDDPCECKDPPPLSSCGDVGKAREVCCRSTRQYGCFCEEEESECEEEEEEEEVVESKTCDLDFRKLEVNPYDPPCDCKDPPPVDSCEALGQRQDVCCRTPRPFTCNCEAYDSPGPDCLKEKAPKQTRQKKQCDKSNPKAKCL